MSINIDIEQLNRYNFRNCLEALARPGDVFRIRPFAGSGIMAMASMLLYSEVSFYQQISCDWNMVKALTNTMEVARNEADYLFLDAPREDVLIDAKAGDQQNPELSATMICSCQNIKTGTMVSLSGPGIDGRKQIILPATENFLNMFAEKNRHFPLGIELYFIDSGNEICALSRTTRVERV